MSHVFISYSKKNHDYASGLADFLMAQGFDIWIDDRIGYGDEWWSVIVNAIMGCAAYIIVMSHEAQASKWVRRELNLADHLDKPLFPLLFEGENWPIFVGTQYVDLRNGSLPDFDFCDRLSMSAPRRKLAGTDVTETQAPDESPVDAVILTQLEQVLSEREIQETPIQARSSSIEQGILKQLNSLLEEAPAEGESPQKKDAESATAGASDEALGQLDDLLG